MGDLPDSLRAVQDETDGTTFYRHQSSPPGPGEEAFFLYIGKKACEVWLRIRIQFPGTKPSGNLRIRIKADDKSYEFPARHLTQSEDPNTRGYWYDELVDPDHLADAVQGGGVVARLGTARERNGADEHVVSDREKQALTIVLGAYHSLGGKLARGTRVPRLRGRDGRSARGRDATAHVRSPPAHWTRGARLPSEHALRDDTPAAFS